MNTMRDGTNCLLVNQFGVRPFNRCKYCDKYIRECFGLQFFIISAAIISLLITTIFVTDLSALMVDIIVVTAALVALLAFLASKETNEIILNNVTLSHLNRDLEEKIKLRANELERSNEELRKLNQMENEFVGIINHELKSPITTVLSGIEVIKARGTEKFDESQKKLLSVMETSTQDMLRLTNNLLDVSTIESGKFEICPENVPFVSILEEVVQALKPEADRKKIRIKTKIDDSINDIYADSVRLKQILFNVIDNAIKYTGENGTVDISANDGGKNIKIDVKDSGIGIKKENLIDVFEKFSKHAAGYKGTGLGLYISKSLIESHNGKIEANSEYGKGSVFSIFLPKAQASI